MKPWNHKGFSLIELMIVVAIIGVLSSIAVPAYRNYIFKAKTSELISYAGAQATNAALFITETGASKISGACTGMANNSGSPKTDITESWAISNDCVISVTSVTDKIGTGTVVIKLTPALATDGSITWDCTSAGSEYAPSNCQN